MNTSKEPIEQQNRKKMKKHQHMKRKKLINVIMKIWRWYSTKNKKLLIASIFIRKITFSANTSLARTEPLEVFPNTWMQSIVQPFPKSNISFSTVSRSTVTIICQGNSYHHIIHLGSLLIYCLYSRLSEICVYRRERGTEHAESMIKR